MSEPLVEARALTKRFGGFVAVDGIDFEIQRGEAFGFLGPNGAGKSSTMRMIGAVSPVSGGTLRVLGCDPAADGPTADASESEGSHPGGRLLRGATVAPGLVLGTAHRKDYDLSRAGAERCALDGVDDELNRFRGALDS